VVSFLNQFTFSNQPTIMPWTSYRKWSKHSLTLFHTRAVTEHQTDVHHNLEKLVWFCFTFVRFLGLQFGNDILPSSRFSVAVRKGRRLQL